MSSGRGRIPKGYYGQYVRDITLSGTTGDSFVAPFTWEFWFVNPPGNNQVTIAKAGRASQTIAGGQVTVLYVQQGEETSLVGTSGQTISVYDHYDVKLIPSSKDVLGKFQLVDSTGANIAGVLVGGQVQTALYDSLGNAIPSLITPPFSTSRGLNVRIVPQITSDILRIAIGATNTVSPTWSALNFTVLQTTTTLGAATIIGPNLQTWRSFQLFNAGAGDVDIGPSTVTFGAGYRLKSGGVLGPALNPPATANNFNLNTLYAVDNNAVTGAISLFAIGP